MKKKFAYALFTALILLLCLTPSLGMLAGLGENEAGGNQALSRAPALRKADGAWNAAYLSQMQDYLGDHFFLRQEMITAWSALNARGFTAPSPRMWYWAGTAGCTSGIPCRTTPARGP